MEIMYKPYLDNLIISLQWIYTCAVLPVLGTLL